MRKFIRWRDISSTLGLYDNRQTNSEFIFTLYGNSISRTGGYQFRATRPDANGEGGWADWTSDSRFFDMFPKGDGSRVKGTLSDHDRRNPVGADNTAQPYVGKLRDAGPASGGYYNAPHREREMRMAFTACCVIILIYCLYMPRLPILQKEALRKRLMMH